MMAVASLQKLVEWRVVAGDTVSGDAGSAAEKPLIEELKILWEVGVETYDISKNQSFQMRAALMWTVNDFPAYAMLSGWSTKGKFACPACNHKTSSRYLKHSRGGGGGGGGGYVSGEVSNNGN